MPTIKTGSLFCFLLLLIGCFWSYDVYGFKSVEKEFDWGVMGAKLIGSESRKGCKVVKNSPYELFLWFGSESFLEGSISIEDIKLINKRTGKTVFMENKVPEQSIEKQNALDGTSYFSFFSFENINMPHQDMRLQIVFQLKQHDNSTEYKINLLFKTDHQKFRRIVGV